jgi:hypothetical protein
MKLKRLAAMGLPELACRARQATSKRLERLGLLGHDRLWLLLNLELWQRIFLDGDDLGTSLRVSA